MNAEVLFLVCGLFLAFLLLREVVCWYWKLTTIVERLTAIDAKLGQLVEAQEEQAPTRPPA